MVKIRIYWGGKVLCHSPGVGEEQLQHGSPLTVGLLLSGGGKSSLEEKVQNVSSDGKTEVFSLPLFVCVF